MNTNQQFAIFCAKKCLHLWDAPEEVKDWLNDPKEETAREAAEAAWAAWRAAVERKTAVRAAREAAQASARAADTVRAAEAGVRVAAKALNTTEKELRLEFVSTWAEEQLRTTDPEWVEYATVELMERV